jgi:hypothetical protein
MNLLRPWWTAAVSFVYSSETEAPRAIPLPMQPRRSRCRLRPGPSMVRLRQRSQLTDPLRTPPPTRLPRRTSASSRKSRNGATTANKPPTPSPGLCRAPIHRHARDELLAGQPPPQRRSPTLGLRQRPRKHLPPRALHSPNHPRPRPPHRPSRQTRKGRQTARPEVTEQSQFPTPAQREQANWRKQIE